MLAATGSSEAAHLEVARVLALLHALHEVHGVVAVDERVLAGSLLAAAPAGITWRRGAGYAWQQRSRGVYGVCRVWSKGIRHNRERG